MHVSSIWMNIIFDHKNSIWNHQVFYLIYLLFSKVTLKFKIKKNIYIVILPTKYKNWLENNNYNKLKKILSLNYKKTHKKLLFNNINIIKNIKIQVFFLL